MSVATFCLVLSSMFCLFMLFRNEWVGAERMKRIKWLYDEALVGNRGWDNLYAEIDNLPYFSMLFQFWKPVESFWKY